MSIRPIYLLIFFIIIFHPNHVHATTTLPWGIMINPNTQECASFWPYSNSTQSLPADWKYYSPEGSTAGKGSIRKIEINTEVGKCSFFENDPADCCEQLGYSYINQVEGLEELTNYKNIARQNKIKNYFLIGSLITIPAALIILILKKKQ